MCDNTYDEIIPYLYLGNSLASQVGDKFMMIVNCTKETEIPFPNNHKNCIRIPINDDPMECDKLISLINDTNIIDRIHQSIINKKNVLVHCRAGMQRSCALVACYLIKYHKFNPSITIKYIKSKRPIAFFGEVNFLSAIELFYSKLQI